MIGTSDLRQLATFTGERAPVLSLYLDTDLSRQLKDQAKLVLRDLLERARQAGASAQDLERVARFVDLEYDWQGRGLIIFSCQEDGLWQPFPLPVPVKSQVYVGDRAFLLPLSKLQDQYAPYAVALVSKEGARLFLIDMGGVIREEATSGNPIKHQKQGGWSASRFQRHEETMAAHNLRMAAEAAARFCEDNACPRLILAGTEENTARFRDFLPTPLRQAVVGTIPVDPAAGSREVVERSREILNELEYEREQALVERTITLARSGGAATLGLADTLFALQENRVLTLLIEEGYTAPGFVCPSCDYLSSDEAEHCLFCGTAQSLPVPNIVERAVHKAIQQGARVEIIAGSKALANAGHIGALLRY